MKTLARVYAILLKVADKSITAEKALELLRDIFSL